MDPDKDHAPEVQIPLLGNIEDWSRTDKDDVFIVRPREERVAQLIATACLVLPRVERADQIILI